MNICEELHSFWQWANIDEYQYSLLGTSQKPFNECLYPRWDDLIQLAKKSIANSNNIYDINCALTIMGLDNETEDILDFCKKLTLEKKINIIKVGIYNIQPETRWQIAVLMENIDLSKSEKYLLKLLNDKDGYVRKRAQSSLKHLTDQNNA